MASVLRFILMVLAIVPFAFAQSTLYLEERNTTFSVQLPTNTSDLHFYFESPATSSWVAVGIGSEMKGALMFFMYSGADKKHVILSPRIATGTSEPTYAQELEIELLSNTTTADVQSHVFRVEAICHNCYVWSGGNLDITSPVQPWMYAFGPSNPVASNSLSVGLTQHEYYGHFNMDMTVASGNGTFPPSNLTSNVGVALEGNQFVLDSDFESPTHGYIMAALTLVFAPLLVLHALGGKRLIWVTELVIVILAVVGLVLGCWSSMIYNRSKNFSTAHQGIGLAVLAVLLIILISHCITKRYTNPDPGRQLSLASYIYWTFGVIIWILAIVNGFLGIELAHPTNAAWIAYGCVLAGMILITTPLFLCVHRREKRARRGKHAAKQAMPNGNGVEHVEQVINV